MSNLDHKPNIELPVSFETLVQHSMPAYKEALLATIKENKPPVSIRLHPFKYPGLNNMENRVPWCEYGQYLEERPVFTLDPLFHAGAYYVQEASSMILYTVLKSLPLKESPRILDLCAAPGGKSTLILDFLKGKGHLVANEVIKSRTSVLEENLIKWGYNNGVVTQNDPADFHHLPNHFDVLIIDAPCSGEGMFRKDPASIKEWSLENVELCASRQKRILTDALPALNNGGFLVYSTCTYNEKENMENVAFLASEHDLINLSVDGVEALGAVELSYQDFKGYQMIPGKVKGEGYFFALFKKKSGPQMEHRFKSTSRLKKLVKRERSSLTEWFSEEVLDQLLIHENGDVYLFNETLTVDLELYLESLKVKYAGIKMGKLVKDVFIPEHALAMSIEKLSKKPEVELSYHDALQFLQKSLTVVDSKEKSWILLTYQSRPLGWAKNLGNRINNYLPSHLRIQMDINR